MRVLQVVASLDESYGGPAFSVPSLANAMSQLGVENWFLSAARQDKPSNNGLLDAVFDRWTEVPLSTFGKSAYFSFETRHAAKALIEKNQIELVHLHSVWNHLSWTVASVARSMGVPYVISPRSELLHKSLERGELKKAIARTLFAERMLKRSAGFHATDEKEAQEIPGEYSATRIISSNGVDFSIAENLPSKDEALRNLNLPEGRRYILFLSRLHERKNPLLLIQAFLASRLSEKGWGLIMAGPSDDPLTRRNIDKELKGSADSHVHFLGQVGLEAKRNCYAAADLFALPTEFENFGNAIADALACGLPVITTAATPWFDLPDRGAGWIVDTSIDSLTHALQQATSLGLDELAKMGVSGRSLVEKYSWHTSANDMLKFYSGVGSRVTS